MVPHLIYHRKTNATKSLVETYNCATSEEYMVRLMLIQKQSVQLFFDYLQ